MFGQSLGRRFKTSPYIVFHATIYNSWPVSMKVKRLSDHTSTSVFALIIKQPSKPFTLSKHSHWYNSDISTHHSVTLICVPENSGAGGNEIADEFTKDGSAQQFVGPGPTLGISGQNITH